MLDVQVQRCRISSRSLSIWFQCIQLLIIIIRWGAIVLLTRLQSFHSLRNSRRVIDNCTRGCASSWVSITIFLLKWRSWRKIFDRSDLILKTCLTHVLLIYEMFLIFFLEGSQNLWILCESYIWILDIIDLRHYSLVGICILNNLSGHHFPSLIWRHRSLRGLWSFDGFFLLQFLGVLLHIPHSTRVWSRSVLPSFSCPWESILLRENGGPL